MSDIDTAINRTYGYITKNFVYIGIVLLAIGLILMVFGVTVRTSDNMDLKITVAGGAVFISGTLFTIASTFARR